MKKVILFGATGNLGRKIAAELVRQGYELTAVVRDENKARPVLPPSTRFLKADACDPEQMKGICNGMDVVISALGKSVSVNDKSKPTFEEVDFQANARILDEAKKSEVKKFVYVSALHSENYQHLVYFKVHHDFSQLLINSGLDYSVIKPPAIFSAFGDLIDMAAGDKKTNPIYEGDLAKICVDSIKQSNAVVEAGGKTIYTRKEINELIQKEINPKGKVRTVPAGLFKMVLPLAKVFNKNMYDKFAFFSEVMQHDTLAPQVGETTLENYLKEKKNQN
jgi:uncharacterized protein YbjT (DUF2867 family)